MAFSLQLPPIFTTLQIPLIYLNNIVALAIGPKHQILRVGISLPILVVLIAQSLYREWHGTWGDHYAINCLVLCAAFVYVDWVLLCTPDKERWRKIRYTRRKDNEKEKVNGRVNGKANGVASQRVEEADEYPVTFWGRMWWATRLATTTRYVGWTSQAKNVRMEVDGSYPRILFILRKSLRILFFFVANDIVVSYTTSTSYGSWPDIVHIKPRLSLTAAPFWTRFWFAWVHIVITYVNLEMCNAAYGVVSVATGLANPRDCPSMFGDLKDLVSVRKLWSSVWHQQCRRIASDPGVCIARDVLHLRKGSFESKYLQLFIGFGVSAFVHGAASMLIHRSLQDDAAFAFFMGQAVIIMIEDHIIDFGKSLGLKDTLFWRLVGLAWVFVVMGATLQSWSDRLIDCGMWIHRRQPDWFGLGPVI